MKPSDFVDRHRIAICAESLDVCVYERATSRSIASVGENCSSPSDTYTNESDPSHPVSTPQSHPCLFGRQMPRAIP